MATVNFYHDKEGKKGFVPIHLYIRDKGNQIKIATSVKVKFNDWDSDLQCLKHGTADFEIINKHLSFLKNETIKYLKKSDKLALTENEIREKVNSLVECYKSNTEVIIIKEPEPYYGQKFTFIDLFAGAGGFSEGFLQAEQKNKIYDFLLASDINENCELTHLARYNHQLGLDVAFLKQDITEPDFLVNLIEKLEGRQVDVICGGPPCQSFSLAGKRKKYDKKDDLFSHYINIIRNLRPKYFVMENVKGILTKENGNIKELIISEIRSIVDLNEFPKLFSFLGDLKKETSEFSFLIDCYISRLNFETICEDELISSKEKYINITEQKFKDLTPKIADYKTSKTDISINTIRHGFILLKRIKEFKYLKKRIINEKAYCNIDNDFFVDKFDEFISFIEPDSIVDTIRNAFNSLNPPQRYKKDIYDINTSLSVYSKTINECLVDIKNIALKFNKESDFDEVINDIRLYNIQDPFIALASDYGVPQNRERVLFIGCRKDQKLITKIAPTVENHDKVTVFEALYDLDFLGNDEESHTYSDSDLFSKLNGSTGKFKDLIRKRNVDGQISNSGLTYADWSKKGRLHTRFTKIKAPFYVRNHEELQNSTAKSTTAPLNNHKTSKQNDDVIKRLNIILNAGDYDVAKLELKKTGLDSEKRNYNILKPDFQSPTIMTIPDDYIHYSNPRALTVREMARLQSFDDSFVFQGKRSTGGNKRKEEVPQFTLVGNAVPPLLARAVATEILKYIK